MDVSDREPAALKPNPIYLFEVIQCYDTDPVLNDFMLIALHGGECCATLFQGIYLCAGFHDVKCENIFRSFPFEF